MPPRPQVSRRTALAAGLGAGVAALSVTGCSVRNPVGAAAGNGAVTVPPDVRAVVRLAGSLQTSIAMLSETRSQYPSLSTRVGPLIAVERAHLDVLRRAAPTPSPSPGRAGRPAVPSHASTAMRQVVRTTEVLRASCYSASDSAQSGAFARLLASMGASLSQRLPAEQASQDHQGALLTAGARTTDTTGIDSLQDTLAAEHAAVYVFGVLAAQTSMSDHRTLWDALDAAYVWHRAARDTLVTGITATGRTPVAASVSYRLPNSAADADQVITAARHTEHRASDVYGTLVAKTTRGVRRWAIHSLDRSAVRQLQFRGRPEIFPGTGGRRTDLGS